MSKSKESLQAAFAGESQANRKYLAFAKKAEQEGRPNLAKLFRAAAEGETVHAHNHLKAMDGVGDSMENLKSAIEGENYEIEEMYPSFIEHSKEEGDKRAENTFILANEVEKKHRDLYSDALDSIGQNQDIEEKKYFVCSVCGHLELDQAPEKCPVCGAPKEMFSEIS